jgi:flagellar hook-basal body complex protein FliE
MTINNVTGVRSDITEMLNRIRDISTKTNVFTPNSSAGLKPEKSLDNSFQHVMSAVKNSVGTVNEMQQQSEMLKNAYVVGDPNVSLSQVMVAAQKSKLAMEGLMIVRNKILDAYKEIMNMQV